MFIMGKNEYGHTGMFASLLLLLFWHGVWKRLSRLSIWISVL